MTFIFTLISCFENEPATTITKASFTMTCPEDWKVDDTSKSHYDEITCEKSGWDSSGLIMLMSFPSKINLEETTQKYIDHFKANHLFSNFSSAEVKQRAYRDFSGVSITYTVSVLGLPHHGEVITFHGCGDRTFTIIEQEALEDVSKNRDGFEIFRNSVKCQSPGTVDKQRN